MIPASVNDTPDNVWTVARLLDHRMHATKHWLSSVGFTCVGLIWFILHVNLPLYCIGLCVMISSACLIAYWKVSPYNFELTTRTVYTVALFGLTVVAFFDPSYVSANFYPPLVLQLLFVERNKRVRHFLSLWTLVSFVMTVYTADDLPLGITDPETYQLSVEISGAISAFVTAMVVAMNRDLNNTIRLTSKAYNSQLEQQVKQTVKANNDLKNQRDLFEETRVKIAKSISDQQQKQEALNKAHHQLEQFAYAASHDLKEPIRTIRSYIQLVRRRIPTELGSSKDFNEQFGFIATSCEAMHNLLEKLLLYQRTGGAPEATKVVNPHLLWHETLKEVLVARANTARTNPTPGGLANEQFDTLLQATNTASKTIPKAKYPLQTGYLKTIFKELIKNALTYCDQATTPTISFDLCVEDSSLQFSITDNGIGIDKKYHQQIFGMFKRLHTREVYPGAGLGLPLVMRTLHLMKGELKLYSSPGAGTTISVSIPLRED